jgi:hypothetical protein
MSSLRQSLAGFKATPRIYLFFPAVVLKLVASAISAVGFVEQNGPYYLIGMALWLIWLGLLWLIAMPSTDSLLRRFQRPLRTVALVLIAVLLVFGLLELSGIFTTGLGDIGVDIIGPNSRNCWAPWTTALPIMTPPPCATRRLITCWMGLTLMPMPISF